jgi:sulfite oxidase
LQPEWHGFRRTGEQMSGPRTSRIRAEETQPVPTGEEPEVAGLSVANESPYCAEPPLSALNAWITPTDRFFVRSHFPVPKIDISTWRLVVDGEVDHPLLLSFEDLRALQELEKVVTLECAGNSRSSISPKTKGVRWQNGAVGTARWSGIPLAAVLAKAGVRAGARHVVMEGADHGREPDVAEEINYGMSVPISKATDGQTMLAYEMNGEPLSAAHGFPVRAIVPGWYGMASVKWITRIHVQEPEFDGFFRTGSYVFIAEGDDPHRPKTPVTSQKVKSLVTWPREDAVLPVGEHVVRGVAWAGERSVAKVYVSTDPVDSSNRKAEWREATILEPRAAHAWVRWEYPVAIDRPGYYVVRARAVDDRGDTQPLHAPWNFRGVATNAVHAVAIVVRNGGR